MRILLFFIALFILPSCREKNRRKSTADHQEHISTLNGIPYESLKDSIRKKKQQFSKLITSPEQLDNKTYKSAIIDYWVKTVSNNLFLQWENTPWDFNGTTTIPQQGTIACGYFVTIILQDMGVVINRTSLSICASSQMMKRLVPGQRIKNLSYLTYPAFNDSLMKMGKGVYVIGLDFHTGIIVNDGGTNWFIHSNYIRRKGVVKEEVEYAAALKASKTRWLVSLTGDKGFLFAWIKGNRLN